MKDNLKQLYASGGGDGPEAVTAAMNEALQMVSSARWSESVRLTLPLLTSLPRTDSPSHAPTREQDWRPHATKLAVLIADAPPHGIGEIGDGFPNGSPDGEDPLQLVRRMAAMGISLLMVACEPALAGYQHAADFFQGLVKVTGGMCVPLTTASLLSHVIVAAAGEAMDMERLHKDIGDDVAERLRALSLEQQQQQAAGAAVEAVTLDDIARELHEKLLLRNESTKQLHIESIYRDTEGERRSSIYCGLQCCTERQTLTASRTF